MEGDNKPKRGKRKPKGKRRYTRNVPSVSYRLPRCWKCKRSRFKVSKSFPRGDDDDALEQYAECQICGAVSRLCGD